jgi:hypothetical protein
MLGPFDETKTMGEISCQFLQPGGSMVPRYILQLLFSEKSQKQPLKLEQKTSTDLESLEF